MNKKANPKISVVTVVYNGACRLEKTIKNVLSQTYDNIEYIIVDGNSDDGSLEIIKKYSSNIAKFITENDNGIYDAMNKGIELASGDWINFMNVEDLYYDNNVIKNIFDNNDLSEFTAVYGDHIVDYGTCKSSRSAGNLERLYRGMQFSHQSLFTKLEYHKNNKYNTDLRIAADFNFIYNTYISGEKFYYANLPVSIITNNGLSDVKRFESLREVRNIIINRKPKYYYRLFYLWLKLKLAGIAILKKVIPKNIKDIIQRLK